MTNKELLTTAGFHEIGSGSYEMTFSNGFTVTATISSAEGIIFGLKKDEVLLQPTIQTVEPDDVAKAFTDLMSLVPIIVDAINEKVAHPENDFKQLIVFLQVLVNYYSKH